MKVLDVKTLTIPDIKVIQFGRFNDDRGYFTEHFRKSDFKNHDEIKLFIDSDFVQCNESFSCKNTVRGLHFQWNPYMGKLVRTVYGHMVDMVLDIRLGSPTFGKIILYDMPVDNSNDYGEWIWVPPGFAHGNFFLKDTVIEYFCTGEYSQGCEAGISPFAADIDWSICEQAVRQLFDQIVEVGPIITDKDRNGFSLKAWESSFDSQNFICDQG